MFTVKPLAAALGVELSGVDFASELTQEVFREVRRLLVKHQVIFFETRILALSNITTWLLHLGHYRLILPMALWTDFLKSPF